MIKKELLVIDEMGLHARPASQAVAMANKFKSNIDIEYNGKKMNMKSVMLVMSLGIAHNEKFAIHFEGEDEVEASEKLTKFLSESKVAE